MKKGFTLIELMVVVIIIGVLSAIAIPEYTKSLEKARAAELALNLNKLMEADRLWTDEMGYNVGYATWREIYYVPDWDCQSNGRNCSSKYFTYQLDIPAGNVSNGNVQLAHGKRLGTGAQYSWAVARLADGTRVAQCTPNDNDLGKEMCDNLVKNQGWILGS